MRVVQATTERLVLRGSSPLFPPFFLGGLGWITLGAGILLGAMAAGRTLEGPLPGDDSATPIGGIVAFLLPFGFFLLLVPFAGALAFRREVIVDRAAGRLFIRDRTLRGSRLAEYVLDELQGVDVEDARHLDGDPYYTTVVKRQSGVSVALDRFLDRGAAEQIAQRVRSYLDPA